MEVLAQVALVMVGWTGISVLVAAIVARMLESGDAERGALRVRKVTRDMG
jgi:hypothetical protein